MKGIKKVNLFCHIINKEEEVNVEVLCTDHHADIAAMMKDQFPEIEHQVDVWYLAKSTTKKLGAKAKWKECTDIRPYIPSIRNHLWWAAASCNGDKVDLIEKW